MVCRWENAQYLGAEMKPLAEELKVMASDAQVRPGPRPAQACYCWMERAHWWGLVLAACQAMRAQLRGKPADRDDTQRRLVLARALSVEVPEEVALSLLLEAEDKDRAPTVPAAGLKDFLDRAASKVRHTHARRSQPCPYFWFRLLWGMVVTHAASLFGSGAGERERDGAGERRPARGGAQGSLGQGQGPAGEDQEGEEASRGAEREAEQPTADA